MAAPDYLRYFNQNATRNKPLSPQLASALGFLPELGVTAEVFSGGQDGKGEGDRRTGSVRHDHGDAADVFFTQNGRRLDWANPEDRPVFEEIVRRGKANGLTGFGAGPGYMQAGSMHVGFGSPGVWGAGGRGANAPDWLRAAYGGAPAGEVPTGAGQETLYGAAGNDDLSGGSMPQNPMPNNPGGLGGLGGFVRSPAFGDWLTAVGTSMMSSGSDAPLENFGTAFANQQQLRQRQNALDQERADKESDRKALEMALMSRGMTADQARAYSSNAQAAGVAVDGIERQQKLDLAQQERDRTAGFLSGLSGAASGDPSFEPSTPMTAPAAGGNVASSTNTGALAQAVRDADDVIAVTGSDAKPEPLSSFSTGHTTVDALMGKRAQVARALSAAPSDDAFQRGKIVLDQLDKEIEQYAPTGAIKEYAFAMGQRQSEGLPPVRYEVWKAEQSKAGATNVTVGAEKTYDTTVGKGYGDLFNDLQKEARSASSTLSALTVMEQAMSNDRFYSGFGAEQLLTARRAAASLGLDPEGISDMETFNAQTKGAALAAMGGSLGAGFSNADRSFVEGQVPSFENTPEGNRKLIDVNRKLAKRKQEIATFARDYARKNEGRLDMGFDDALSAWAEANPLFPQVERPASGAGSKGGYTIRSVR